MPKSTGLWPGYPCCVCAYVCVYMCVCRRTSLHVPEKVKVLVTQLRQTLCDPIECNPSGSSVHGHLQVRILEWVAIPFSRVSFQPRD